jgi:hypothetical protein
MTYQDNGYVPRVGYTQQFRQAAEEIPELLFAYTYDDFDGTVTSDETGYFPNLTCPGASPTTGVTGLCQTRTFNGTGLNETSDSNWGLLNEDTDWSVSFWCQPKTGAGAPYGGDGYALRVQCGAGYFLNVSGPATSTTGTWINVGSVNWQHNGISVAWHHHVITYEAATGTVTEYFDGGGGTNRGTATFFQPNCTGISGTCFGYYDTTRPIDEFYGWRVLLTAQEASDLWNSGSGAFYPSIPRA